MWGVRRARSPAHTRGERPWLFVYAIASTAYRVFISIVIILFLSNRLPRQLFVVAVFMGIAAAATWLLVPLGKLLRYLAGSGELARVRPRAMGTTLAFTAVVVGVLGFIPMADRCRVEGVVEPRRLTFVHAQTDGFLEGFLPSGTHVTPGESILLRTSNRDLTARKERLDAERRRLEARRRLAQTRDIAASQLLADQIKALDKQIDRVNEEIALLQVRPRFAGLWVAPGLDQQRGRYLRRGDKVGLVVGLDDMIIRATAGQQLARLIDEAEAAVDVRVKGRPETAFDGEVESIIPAGQQHLPSAALGYLAGGSMEVSTEDRQGVKTAERFFEIRVRPDPQAKILSGQRVVVRFHMPAKPLAVQWWRSILQVLQRRFHI